MLESYRKYCSWIYKGLGIVLQIFTVSVSGAVSRALAQVIGSLMFPLEDLTKESAIAAIALQKDEDE
jgi:hypothetical protein